MRAPLYASVLLAVAKTYALIIDDRDPAITYSGVWEVHPSPLNFNNGHALSVAAGTASFKFRGSYVSLLSSLWPYVVSTSVQLDGGPIITIDLRDYFLPLDPNGGPETTAFASVWSQNGLDTTVEHTLNILPGPDGFTVLDAIEYTPANSQSSSSSLPSVTSSSSSRGSTTTSSSTSSPSSSTNVDSATTLNSGGSKSNTLAIAIGSSVGAVALLAALLIFFFCCRRRRKSHAKQEQSTDIWGKPSPPHYPPVDLLASDSVQDLPGTTPPSGAHSRPLTTTSYNTESTLTAGFAGLGTSSAFNSSPGGKSAPIPQMHHPYSYSTYSNGDESAYARSGLAPPVPSMPVPMPVPIVTRQQKPTSALAQYSANEKQRVAYSYAQRDAAAAASPQVWSHASTSAREHQQHQQLPPGAQRPLMSETQRLPGSTSRRNGPPPDYPQ